MSEGIIIALIGFIGAVLGAAIVGSATITASSFRKGENPFSCGLLGLLTSIGAAFGLVLGVLLGAASIHQTPREPYQTVVPQVTQTVTVPTATAVKPLDQPTAAPVSPTLPRPAPTTVVLKIPDLIVPATASNGVLFTAPLDGNYRFMIKDGVYCTMPNLCRSIIRGYLGRDIVWKDWYGLPHPMDQDYELGCWEDKTASNRNCGVGSSTIVSMKAQQFIRWVVVEDKNAYADNTGAVVLAVERLP